MFELIYTCFGTNDFILIGLKKWGSGLSANHTAGYYNHLFLFVVIECLLPHGDILGAWGEYFVFYTKKTTTALIIAICKVNVIMPNKSLVNLPLTAANFI